MTLITLIAVGPPAVALFVAALIADLRDLRTGRTAAHPGHAPSDRSTRTCHIDGAQLPLGPQEPTLSANERGKASIGRPSFHQALRTDRRREPTTAGTNQP